MWRTIATAVTLRAWTSDSDRACGRFNGMLKGVGYCGNDGPGRLPLYRIRAFGFGGIWSQTIVLWTLLASSTFHGCTKVLSTRSSNFHLESDEKTREKPIFSVCTTVQYISKEVGVQTNIPIKKPHDQKANTSCK